MTVKSSGDPGRGRRWASRAATILACLTLALSVPVLWLHQTVLTTDGYVRLVGDLPADPEFAEAVGDAAARAIVTRLSIDDRVKEVLPDAAGPLVDVVTRGIQDRLGQALGEAVASPRVVQAWANANATLHREILEFLRGDEGAIGLQGSVVTLDLAFLIAGALNGLQDVGVIPADVNLPEDADDTRLDEALDALRARGWNIPEDFAAIPLMEAPRLGMVQRIVDLFDAIALVLPLLAIGLTGLALWLSSRRSRTLAIVATAGAVTAGLLLVVVLIVGRVSISTPYPEGAAIIASIEQAITDSLRSWAVGTLAVMGALYAVAWLLRRREQEGAAGTASTAPAGPGMAGGAA